ncbi:MAG: hypothetical protein ING66_03850 [Rhodocyclaceae bacterium]|nr:hypothetical protein [Rhodocyclaceae bacterium]MCA3061782.1 hypothetical protein [Rhodocyclaceae bacterium]
MPRDRQHKFPGWIPGLYSKTGKKRTLYYTLFPHYTALGHDIALARRKLLELQNHQYASNTIGELLDDFMKYRQDLSQRTGKPSAATIDGNKRELLPLKYAFGRMSITELTTSHVWQYLHEHRGREAPVRSNREVSLLGACFNYARNRGLVTNNPCTGVEKNTETPRQRLVSLEELRSFCNYARSNLYYTNKSLATDKHTGVMISGAFELAFLTGKAVSQILSVERSHIKADGVEFSGRKGGHDTLVEWTPALRQLVDELFEKSVSRESKFLICNCEGHPYTLGGFSSLWRRVMASWLIERKKIDPTAESFHFHDLRAMAISSMKEQGRDAKELTGHVSDQMPNLVYDRRRIRKSKAVM